MYVSGDCSVRQSAATSSPRGSTIDQVLVDVRRAGVEQQLLDDHLGHRVLALAEVVVADPALGVGDVDAPARSGCEGAPDPVVAVDRDRVLDAEGRATAR